MSPHPSMIARNKSNNNGLIGPAPLPVVLVFIEALSPIQLQYGSSINIGDQLVAVNGISVLNATSLDYVEKLVQQCGNSLTITVSPVEQPNYEDNQVMLRRTSPATHHDKVIRFQRTKKLRRLP